MPPSTFIRVDFGSAILAKKRDDLSAMDVEAYALKRLRAAERLGDILETQDARIRQVALLPRPRKRMSSLFHWSSYGSEARLRDPDGQAKKLA